MNALENKSEGEATSSVDESLSSGFSFSSRIQYPIRYKATKIFLPPNAVLERNRVLSALTPPPVLQSYKLLRTQVLHKLQATGWNSIGVLCARAGGGSSLTAINLAISLAMDPRATVLLVDLNLRSPAIHRFFDFEPEFGVLDVIAQKAALADVLFNPGIDSLSVLPGKTPIENSSELLASPEASRFVQDIKSRYRSRVIIFDLPPALEADDAIAFSENYDAGLVVISEKRANESDLIRMSDLMQKVPVLGTVFNDAF